MKPKGTSSRPKKAVKAHKGANVRKSAKALRPTGPKSVLEGLSGDVFEVFSPLVKKEKYPEGSLIFAEGSKPDRFFIIEDGEVEIRKVIDRASGSYKLVSILTKGDFFGEMAIFLGQPRTADAYAKTGLKLLSVAGDDVSGLLTKSADPGLKAVGFLASVLSKRLRDTTKELAAVYDTGRLIASARSVHELAGFVMENVFRAVEQAEAGLFAVWNGFNREFEAASERGFGLGPGSFLPDTEGLAGWFMESKEAFLSFDLKKDDRLSATKGGKGGILDGRSLLAAPFFSDGRLTGFILLLNKKKTAAFSYSQMVLLTAIGGYVSIAIDNLARVQEEMDRVRLSRMKSSVSFS